jgi:tetratricopeptide (TPR) repeat protein
VKCLRPDAFAPTRAGAIAFGLLMLGATSGSFVDDRSLTDAQRYDLCLKRAQEDAATTYEQALAWHDAGGGPAAIHCSAVALVQLKEYAQAGFKLDALARERDAGDAGLRAQLLDEAGNAWILAGQPENAEASFTGAIELGDRGADVFGDRARARAEKKDWAGAESDLSSALSDDPSRPDLLVLRASALHALGRRREARSDIDQALTIAPRYAEAMVERGAMKLEAGDPSGARADWLAVLATQPKSPAADSARTYIEKLELGQAGKPASRRKTPTTPH